MKTGPAPKPSKLKTLEGNPGKRQLAANEPQPQPAMTNCPPFLKGAGRQEWKRISFELYQLGLLTKIDRAALTGYCSSWGLYADAEKELARLRREYRDMAKQRKKHPNIKMPSNGMVSITSNGNVIMEPLLSVRKQALEQMHKFLTEFGMTPASRGRIEVDKVRKTNDPMEAFMDHGQRKN
jgi:P27 family predicted phage terminase small subunit